ncbi:hypothetical protein Tco_0564439 [Tanacetum coccineum]
MFLRAGARFRIVGLGKTAWTTEEEIALAKGWRSVSENSERGNARKKDGFWVEVMEYVESKTKQEDRRTYDMVVGKWKVVRPAVVRFCGIYSNVMRMAQESGAATKIHSKGKDHYQVECDTSLIVIIVGRNSRPEGMGLMVTELTAAEVAQRGKFMELKRREVECREREIAVAEYRALLASKY